MKGSIKYEENFKNFSNFLAGNGYYYYCRWVNFLGVHLSL